MRFGRTRCTRSAAGHVELAPLIRQTTELHAARGGDSLCLTDCSPSACQVHIPEPVETAYSHYNPGATSRNLRKCAPCKFRRTRKNPLVILEMALLEARQDRCKGDFCGARNCSRCHLFAESSSEDEASETHIVIDNESFEDPGSDVEMSELHNGQGDNTRQVQNRYANDHGRSQEAERVGQVPNKKPTERNKTGAPLNSMSNNFLMSTNPQPLQRYTRTEAISTPMQVNSDEESDEESIEGEESENETNRPDIESMFGPLLSTSKVKPPYNSSNSSTGAENTPRLRRSKGPSPDEETRIQLGKNFTCKQNSGHDDIYRVYDTPPPFVKWKPIQENYTKDAYYGPNHRMSISAGSNVHNAKSNVHYGDTKSAAAQARSWILKHRFIDSEGEIYREVNSIEEAKGETAEKAVKSDDKLDVSTKIGCESRIDHKISEKDYGSSCEDSDASSEGSSISYNRSINPEEEEARRNKQFEDELAMIAAQEDARSEYNPDSDEESEERSSSDEESPAKKTTRPVTRSRLASTFNHRYSQAGNAYSRPQSSQDTKHGLANSDSEANTPPSKRARS